TLLVQVMAILVILISSDSSKDSIGTPAGRVILFGTIPTIIPDTTPLIAPPTTDAPTIPLSPDYTPTSPDYSPASEAESDPSEDPTSGHIPPLPATSPFLSSDDDTTDNVEDDPRETRVEWVVHPAMPEDIPEPAQGGAAEGTIVGVESAVIALTERVSELERDNQRLRGTASVESQRVDRL
nr:hypothetical protein [Tanacetum cinerariifolium]